MSSSANTVNENLVQILSLCSFAINIHRNVPLAATTATSTPEPELKACLSQELPVAEPIGAEQSKRIAAIEDTMVLGSNSPGFSAIIGHADAKQILREAVVWPVSMPHLFQGTRCMGDAVSATDHKCS
jgi:SpoVK/Ycf46/Vps4 family AAA+-type ATPase